MNIEREWALRPPLLPMTSMHALWSDFIWRRADPTSPICTGRDNIPDWCAEAPDALTAMQRAIRSKRPSGKMHNHQSKVSLALPAYERRCVRYIGAFMRVENFGSLHHLFEMRKTRGIGPMTIYDVAVRFGAFRGLKPEYIYIHAGTKAGLKALGIDLRGQPFVSMDMLEEPLNEKDPDTVEDFLCTYRMAFEKL